MSSLADKCRRIRLILSDVDGVLTDGRILLDHADNHSAHFNVRDGLGIHLWRASGGRFGFVTGRDVPVVRLRAEALRIDILKQGKMDKLPVMDEILAAENLDHDQVCFIGDDLLDLTVIRAAGLGIAVEDAVEEVRAVADYTTSVPGGHGAVREAIELILKNTNRWEETIQRFTQAT